MMQILADTLDKKISLLQELIKESEQQAEAVQQAEVDWDAFDAGVERKGKLIEDLTKLDDGFETTFGRLKEELVSNLEKYKALITDMQEKIRTITALSANLEKQEYLNKTLVEKAFADARSKMRDGKRSSKVALDYYKRMNQVNYIDPQLMDRKS